MKAVTSMEIMNILVKLSKDNHGIISTKAAVEKGVSRAMLSKVAMKNEIIRIVNGQYILASEIEDEMFSLSCRSEVIIFSHESALFLNGISERTPFEHTLTIPSSKKLSKSISENNKIYYVKDELHTLGKTYLRTPAGSPVPVYDMERTICDVIRSRNRISEETFFASLKLYANHQHKNMSALQAYSQAFGVTSVVRKYLEVLL